MLHKPGAFFRELVILMRVEKLQRSFVAIYSGSIPISTGLYVRPEEVRGSDSTSSERIYQKLLLKNRFSIYPTLLIFTSLEDTEVYLYLKLYTVYTIT